MNLPSNLRREVIRVLGGKNDLVVRNLAAKIRGFIIAGEECRSEFWRPKMHYSVYSEISEQGTGGEGTEILLPLTLGQEGGVSCDCKYPPSVSASICSAKSLRGPKIGVKKVCKRSVWASAILNKFGANHRGETPGWCIKMRHTELC